MVLIAILHNADLHNQWYTWWITRTVNSSWWWCQRERWADSECIILCKWRGNLKCTICRMLKPKWWCSPFCCICTKAITHRIRLVFMQVPYISCLYWRCESTHWTVMDPAMRSKGRCFSPDRRLVLPVATAVQQQFSSVLPFYPVDVLVDQGIKQRDRFSHRDLVPNGTGVRSGSPVVVWGPPLLLCRQNNYHMSYDRQKK